MSPKAFNHFGRKMLGLGAVALSLTVAACGSSSTAGGTTTTPATVAPATCTVTTSDLSLGAGGTSAATAASISGSKTLKIDGSTALAPLFQSAQAAFDKANGTTTTITPNGSGTGLKDVASGAVDIGMSDVFASEKAVTGLTDNQVGVVIFSLVVSSDLQGKVTNLTSQQIKDIYAGNTTNWSQVGGPSEPITVIVRTAGSGTRATFDRYVIGDPATKNDQPVTALSADKTGDVVTAVTGHPGSIAYVGTSFVLNEAQKSALNPICIDGNKPTQTDVNAGKYQFWSFEHAYTKTGGPAETAGSAAQAFLTYVKGTDFQSMDLPRLGFLTVTSIPAAVATTHQVK
ncbi:MAG: substrate-binding domain-containing protein [Ktedonobacterales bacterium]|nr:substrate-binding domain-containing protein [Ktedonobacterales bacterium]